MFNRLLSFIIFFLIITISGLLALNYYLYKVRVVENTTYKDVRKDLIDNSISQIDAEQKNLDSLVKKKENINIKETTIANFSSNESGIKMVYKLTENSYEKIDDFTLSQIPIFFVEENVNELNDLTVASMIVEVIKKESLQEIDIDVSIVNKVLNIESLVKDIIQLLNPISIKINIGLPPKWSDYQDYEYLKSVSRFYSSNADLKIINNLTHKIRIHGYGYTTINSSKAGPISPSEWVENIIQYYIFKGIEPAKVDLVINNTGYKWSNRPITNNYIFNYVLSTKQVEVIPSSDLNNLLAGNNLKNLSEFRFEDNVVELNDNGNINIIVYPKLSLQSKIKEVVKSYGLNGFIYKNF